jgi:hypothetical protein
MRKSIATKIMTIMLTLALTLGPCAVTMAAGSAGATRNSLKSQGNIVYSDGDNSVEIYSDDLYTIADKLDSYKTGIADQLGKIHTYFTYNTGKGTGTTTNSKVNVTHTAPSSADTADPLAMDFDTLLEGLAASQSIPTDVTEYGYSSGQKLYQTADGSLTTDSSGNTQIDIAAATASNLSAGTAAWVNGNLILGTGADNAAYYNKGYNSGYDIGAASNALSNSITVTGAKNKLSKGKYLYFLMHTASTAEDSSCYFKVNVQSISNSSVNKLKCLQAQNLKAGPARSILCIWLIDVEDDSATVNLGVTYSTGCANNVEIRRLCQLQ